MQSTNLYCNKEQGTVEVTLSKREIAVEKAKIVADYKRIDTNVYEVNMFYGFTDSDILQPYMQFKWSITYDEVRGCIVETIKKQLDCSKTKAELRSLLRNLRYEYGIEADYAWKIVKFYPAEYDTGFKDIEVVVEYQESINNVGKIKIFITTKHENRISMKNVIVDDCKDILSKVNEIVKEQLLKGGELKEFIFEKAIEIGVLE